MCKLTAISPSEKTHQVVTMLGDEPEANNVLTMRVNAPGEDKDVMTAFVNWEAIDIVLEHLRTLREWQPGELSFIEVDYAMRRSSSCW